MQQKSVDTCYCLIGHPKAPKFLAVKHTEGWSPPTVNFPSQAIDTIAKPMREAVLSKYGLSIRILRPLLRTQNAHYVEMELAQQGASRPIEAVWVDRNEYLRMRSASTMAIDPYELWFRERQNQQERADRVPWHEPGWFAAAEQWILDQVRMLGLEATDEVEQHRIGSDRTCELSVSTASGRVYFKASVDEPPAEPALTMALAEAWPDVVEKPLAVNHHRLWMLNRDLRSTDTVSFGDHQLAEFAGIMAQLQVESINLLDQWKELGCRELSLTAFGAFCADAGDLPTWLGMGDNALEQDEIDDFNRYLEKQIRVIDQLSELKIPSMLVHPEFRRANLSLTDDGHRLTNWFGAYLSHPFMVLADAFSQGDLAKPVQQAYLEAFTEFASPEALAGGVQWVKDLSRPWTFIRLAERVGRLDPKSELFRSALTGLQNRARQLIGR